MKSFENVAKSLYKLLSAKDFSVSILDTEGVSVTSPSDARIFNFDYKTATHEFGSIVILLSPDPSLDVFSSNSFDNSSGSNEQAKQAWYDFLYQLRMFAKRHLLGFSVKDMSKLKFTMKDIAAVAKDDPLAEGWTGTRKSSHQMAPGNVKLIIRHSKNIEEGAQRFRNIKKLFIENSAGERFLVNSTKLTCGRMLARHVAEGGTPYDDFGQHIYSIVEDLQSLSTFVRSTNNKQLSETSSALREQVMTYYGTLKKQAKTIVSHRGYTAYKESWEPSSNTYSTDTVRTMFTEDDSIDTRIEQCLPLLAKIAESNKEQKMSVNDQFEQWANQVVEGTWAVPDSPDAINQLRDILSNELIVGVDAVNATGVLYDLIGDDDLFDLLADYADKDPDGDVAPQVKAWLKNNLPDYYSKIFTEGQVEEMTADAAPTVKVGDNVEVSGITGKIIKLNPGTPMDKTETATVLDTTGKEHELPLTAITMADENSITEIDESDNEVNIQDLTEMSTLIDRISIAGITFELDGWANGKRSIATDHLDAVITGSGKIISLIWAKLKALPKNIDRNKIEIAWDKIVDQWMNMRTAESAQQNQEVATISESKQDTTIIDEIVFLAGTNVNK